MGKIGYGYGSECHLLRYLGRYRHKFNGKILKVTGGNSLDWLDFRPNPKQKPWPDAEWKGIDFLAGHECSRVKEAWAKFWPQRGNPPNWDAVGRLTKGVGTEWLLVEAKAHTGELRSECAASDRGGRKKIAQALEQTKCSLGITSGGDWLRSYYQLANRIAMLQFLTSHEIPSRLLLIYFLGDRGHRGPANCPADEAGWKVALEIQDEHLGLRGRHPLSDRIHKLFLPVCPQP